VVHDEAYLVHWSLIVVIMDSGITKILKSRPTNENKSDDEVSMDVDASEPVSAVTPTVTSSSEMDVSDAAPPAPTEPPAPEQSEISAPSTPQPTAEELRLMRLRRFGGTPSAPSEPSAPVDMPAKTTAASTRTPTMIFSPVSPSNTSSVGTSPSYPGSGTSSTRLTPSATPFNTPSHTPVDSSFLSSSPGVSASPKFPGPIADKSSLHPSSSHTTFDYNAWVHKTICSIFSVRSNAPLALHSTSTFGSDSENNVSRSHVFDMQSILSPSAGNTHTPRSPNAMDVTLAAPVVTQFTIDDVDLILMNILSTHAKDLPSQFSVIEYFAHCLARLDGLKRLHPVSATPAPAQPLTVGAVPLVLVELSTRLYNYFSLTLVSAPAFAAFSEPLLENPEYVSLQMVRILGRGLLHKDHLQSLANAIGEEMMPSVFEPVFLRCSALSRMHSANTQFDNASQAPIHAFRALVGAGKQFVSVLTKHPRWTVKPTDNGQAIDLTLLGCLFTYTPLFALGHSEAESNLVSLPTTAIGDLFFDVLRDAKDSTLDWIATVLIKNRDANKMGAAETLSSTGFANSFSTAMLRLSKPFMDRLDDKKSRYANYDATYFTRSKRMGQYFDVSETRIVADKSTFEAWQQSLEEAKGASGETIPFTPTFITECFHMTLLSLIQQSRIYRIYADVFERHAEMKRSGLEPKNFEGFARIKASIEDVIFAPLHFQEAFLFWEMVGVWLARVASTPDGQQLSGSTRFYAPPMPLPSTPPKAYQCLPEMILENYATFFMFAALYWEKFADQEHTDLMNSLVTLLSSPAYVKNPHIRVKMVQVLTVLMPRGKGGRLPPKTVSPFDTNFVISNLGPALTLLYCDVERTGSASQFYDRLNARHELSSILVFLWTDRPGHKESIVAYWDHHPDNFESFADKLLNDSIFLLDEGLSKLFESRGAQSRLDAGLIANDAERREATETMERGARQTRSFMVLLRESLRIFSMVALNHPRLFMTAGMHERLATSLNYCLYQIHGPRRAELRLPNPEKYEFEPAWVVDRLCACILSFATYDKSFVDFLAKDTRSYSDELYQNAASFIEQHNNGQSDFELKTSAWRAMAAAVKDVTQHVEALEEELGDIPDDFLDPLMATLMTDPVTLPSSGVTLDRSVIERSLLADPIDPYNRSPLTADQLIPNTELKQKIDAFIAEKRKKA